MGGNRCRELTSHWCCVVLEAKYYAGSQELGVIHITLLRVVLHLLIGSIRKTISESSTSN